MLTAPPEMIIDSYLSVQQTGGEARYEDYGFIVTFI